MSNTILATTKHFSIQWWNGCDSDGIFIYQSNDDEVFPFLNPQAFIHLDCLQGLIDELNVASKTVVIKNRIPDGLMMYANRRYNWEPMPFVPNAHRKDKKSGGVWGQPYYTPLSVMTDNFKELTSAINFACSQENVERLESMNCNEGWYVLNGVYLKNRQWYLIGTDKLIPAFPRSSDVRTNLT